jgi:hypothetical protein
LIGEKEYYSDLFHGLYRKLSKLEKSVFILYTYKFSYEEITDKINIIYKQQGNKRLVNIKSIDNALSRIKTKAKEVYDKHREEN